MRVTIRELAAKCGLSISTVSKALNDYTDVNEETRRMVSDTAQRMGYRPNSIARALKTRRTFNLGVLFADESSSGLTHNYFSAVLEGFKLEAERQGYDITFINHNIGYSHMTYLQHCQYRNVDGVCIACINFAQQEVAELLGGDIPIVTIDHPIEGRSCVQSDNLGGMQALATHVIALGHTRVAYVAGRASAVTTARVNSFLTTLQRHGIEVPPEYMHQVPYHNPGPTADAVRELLALPTPPTCILMPDDYAALGGMEAIASAGLRIPQDISIAGYDGVKLMQQYSPRITTVWQDTLRIGGLAAEQLILAVEQPQTEPTIITVPSTLLAGETVAAM